MNHDKRVIQQNLHECMAGLGTRFLFEQLFRKPQKVMLIGPACSPDSQAVSQTAYYWNLITLSYSAASSALSNRDEYPYFFRTYVPDAMYNPLRIKILKAFNWTRVATIHTNFEVFSLAIDNLRTLLKQANITILASESFGESPKNQIENIKASNAYHNGMYGKNYMWILLGWWSKDWWLVDENSKGENLTCTPDELIETVASSMYISTEVEQLDLSSKETVAGYTALEIQKMYQERLQSPEYSDARASGVDFFGYDAVWSIALTLNTSSAMMDAGFLEDGSMRNLEDFNYDDNEMSSLFFNVFQDLKFQGATGHVSFSDADRVGPTKLEQLQGKNET
ncbi:putative gamma-aminobutyric acid type B receptor subunit 1-like [Apostichopus japonicus]|uniref:Putative gamma-aminobutyric acid type B receptor subunit 1-like n=1 Tax=Stichopus japonicus TaxID=307972 RepID=A0A2G8L9I3_STIJA|nr:putative gamma-aminobutyric acid type B receptor subunit 1-like [Apostichopus japonicus]